MDIKSVAAAIIIFVLSNSVNASTIVINEFLPNAIGADGGNEWIELFNNSSTTVDISGWRIQKATSSYSTIYTLPINTTLNAGGYLVIGGANVVGATLSTSQLGLGNAGSSGDAVRLIDELSNVIDTVIYGPNNNDSFLDDFGNIALSLAPTPNAGQSLGRFLDGVDTHNSGNDFIVFDNPSLNLPNNISSVPLPAAAWLFLSGLIGLIGFTRRNTNT